LSANSEALALITTIIVTNPDNTTEEYTASDLPINVQVGDYVIVYTSGYLSSPPLVSDKAYIGNQTVPSTTGSSVYPGSTRMYRFIMPCSDVAIVGDR